jgi:hypothetical protein
VEIDVWDGEPPSSSSSSSDDEAANALKPKVKKEKKEKKELSIRKRLELRFGRKGSPSPEEKKEEWLPPSGSADQTISPWRSNSSTRAEPRVLHGYTLTKDTSFRAVCATIRDYAFVTSHLPLIVSLEVHTSPEQQDIMVEIMTEYWRGMLVDLPFDPYQSAQQLALPTLKELEKKILVKVKRSSPKAAEAAKPTTLQAPAEPLQQTASANSDATTSASSEDDPEAPNKPPAPKTKITDALARLGTYTGAYSFKSLDQPGQSSPHQS